MLKVKTQKLFSMILTMTVLLVLYTSQMKSRVTQQYVLSASNEWKILLNFLKRNNIFLADNEKLSEIKTFISSKYLNMDFDSFENISNILSFGIMDNSIEHFSKVNLFLIF